MKYTLSLFALAVVSFTTYSADRIQIASEYNPGLLKTVKTKMSGAISE